MEDSPPTGRLIWKRSARGFILVIWLLLLTVLALFAVTGRFTLLATSLTKAFGPSGDRNLHPNPYLNEYLLSLDDFRDAPPIGAVLDVLIPSPCWENRIACIPEPEQKIRTFTLFRRIHDRLNSLYVIPWAEKMQAAFFLPDGFKNPDAAYETTIDLPREVTEWIQGHNRRMEENIKRDNLINQILLLMVLGAFGSLLFLIDKFINGEDLSLAAVALRPLFGIFLAIAVYVIDMASHAVVSNAHYREMRPETLYLLALAGGLMSERVYSFVISKLGGAVPGQGPEGPPQSGKDNDRAAAEAQKTE